MIARYVLLVVWLATTTATGTHVPWANLLDIRGGSSNDAQYSFSLTTFNPRGRLSQIEYAMNAVAAGSLTVAVKYAEGVVLASLSKLESALIREVGTSKITHVSETAAILYAGLAADSRVLTRRAQLYCLNYMQKFGEGSVVPVFSLVSELSSMMQEYTQMAGVRPFGVALLVAGVDEEWGGGEQGQRGSSPDTSGPMDGPGRYRHCPHLYRVDPSGQYRPWKAAAIGKESRRAEALLEEGFREGMGRDEAIELAVSVIRRSAGDEVSREDIDVAVVEAAPSPQ